MCTGVPLFANNKKALYGEKTNSHTTAAEILKIKEDDFRKYEYHWFDKKIVDEDYDDVAEVIVSHIDKKKSDKLVRELVKKHLGTQKQLANWLRGVPDEWGHLMEPRFTRLAKMMSPKLVIYQDKIKKFKKQDIEKYNPYQAEKLPGLREIKKALPKKIGAQVWNQVRGQVWAQVWYQLGDQVLDQVWDQMWDQVGDQVRDQVWDQVWDQVGAQVGAQVGDQVGDQVRDQVGAQVWDQVGDQVWAQMWAVSYWGIRVTLSLPIKHWFFDWLKLGVMVVFVSGKAKVFGKKGKFLGEYDEKDIFS